VALPRIASLKTPEAFAARLAELGLTLPFDATLQPAPGSPLARPLAAGGLKAGNRWAILPMEGWDGTTDGRPSDLTRRRWRHFGLSGAKIMWGGEAVAVRDDGRANPNQLVLAERTLAELADLRRTLVDAHQERYGRTDDVVIGLQLTHSGRFSRPTAAGPAPRIAYRHALLDARVGVVDDRAVMSDAELDALVADFVVAARRARELGFDFVDVKHCHGYLGHELLSGVSRQGAYGGSFEGRTRFLREIVAGIRAEVPGLAIGVRLSAFDMVPFRKGHGDTGEPAIADAGYQTAFGFTPAGGAGNIDDADAFLRLCASLGITWVCLTAGSPYYNPHIQRPALFPPSDGYLPPEDPLVGVARQIEATARLKARHPELVIVGSAYSYLQEWLPHVAQRVVADGMVDAVGLGRMVLSYPDMPADVLAGAPLKTRLLCRTFSDCTTGPRNGLVSGCYPLDPFYTKHPQHATLKELKKKVRAPEPT
jgi:2,4-dienoyl-CoA reductase-like NADH-dependent reductase (Old Yellow Enzyme family)